MKTAIVIFSDGQVIATSINGTVEDVKAYYAPGKQFNLGSVKDDMQEVVECLVIPEDKKIEDSEGNKWFFDGLTRDRDSHEINGVNLRSAYGEKEISIHDLKFYIPVNFGITL